MRRIANPFYAARRSAKRAAAATRRPSTHHAPGDGPARHAGTAAAADWTSGPCWYVVADTGERRIWLAGPFRTRDEAAGVAPQAALWAVFRSGDEHAGSYQYGVHQHGHGRQPSALGRHVP